MGDYDSLKKMLPAANEKTGTVTIKGICDSNIRRIPILQMPTYDELCFMMHRMFRPHLSTNLDNLVLFYQDEDGDQVLITDDMDISHALTHSSVLRITVYDKECLPPPRSRSDLSSALRDLHLSSKSLASLKSGLRDVLIAVENILEALPDENDGTSSGNNAKTSEQVPKMKPLTTADMAELLDSAHSKPATSSSSSAACMESVTYQVPTQSQAQQSASSQQTSQQHPTQQAQQQSQQPQPQSQQQSPQQVKTGLPPVYQADGSPYNVPRQPPYGMSNPLSAGTAPSCDHAPPTQQQPQPPQRHHSVSGGHSGCPPGYQYPPPTTVPLGQSSLPPPQHPQPPQQQQHPQTQQQQYAQHQQRPYLYPTTYPAPPHTGQPGSSPYAQPQMHAPYYSPQGQVPPSPNYR